jgi:hypothetical protein
MRVFFNMVGLSDSFGVPNSSEKSPNPEHSRKLWTSLGWSDLQEAKPVNSGMHCDIFLNVDEMRIPQRSWTGSHHVGDARPNPETMPL